MSECLSAFNPANTFVHYDSAFRDFFTFCNLSRYIARRDDSLSASSNNTRKIGKRMRDGRGGIRRNKTERATRLREEKHCGVREVEPDDGRIAEERDGRVFRRDSRQVFCNRFV